jgi:purine-cytosine permease-like protein
LDVGKIGDPTDIGGGFILLIGYALTAVGFLMIVLDFVRHRSNRH